MTLNPSLLTSRADDWSSPQQVVDALSDMFGPFTLDPCCAAVSAKAAKFYTKEDDGLAQSWAGETVFMNPPYGRTIAAWVEKAYRESQQAETRVVCLIPARTDTRYWHDYVMRSSVVLLVKGRLTFGDAAARFHAPFPSAVVVFDAPLGVGVWAPAPSSPAFSAWVAPKHRSASVSKESAA
jgi:phage N-6-adenine-methyltransferase